MSKYSTRLFPAALAIILAFTFCAAQSRIPLVELRGEVKDQRGDVIAGARIILTRQGKTHEATSDERGRFRILEIAAGDYTLKINADGFAEHEKSLTITAIEKIVVTLYPSIKERVEVREAEASLDPERAVGAQILKEEQLRLLPDDPDQFIELLQLLATSSGSAPGQADVTVDGFAHEGRLPPKSAIREVRINSNIFSAEYDKPPYRGGRIDIYTKPGASSFHGSTLFNFNDSTFNARDPFAPERAPITTRRYGLQLGGPIVPKRSGFTFDFEARDIAESTTVNAIILDRDFQPSTFNLSVGTPKLLMIGSARSDWMPGRNHTFIFRYDFNLDQSRNQNVGGLDLSSRASGNRAVSHSLRFAETGVLSKSIFNEARAGVTLNRVEERASSSAPAISVLGAFTDGGATLQSLAQKEWRIEFNDNLSAVKGPHTLKLGAQILGRYTSDSRADNFNGTFVFGGALAPQLDDRGKIVAVGDGKPVMVNISGLEQYRRTLLSLPGGRPTQFSISHGDPLIKGSQWTIAGFAQDEWRLRRDTLLSLGLRYEAQTGTADRISLGPRIGIGYSPDKKQRWVLRARAGIFYDRISLVLPLETLRLDGKRQQQIIIASPSFPDPFKGGTAVEQVPTVRRENDHIRPPTSFQAQLGVERQLPRGWKIEVSHYWSRGWGLVRSRNVNAPIIGDGGTEMRPLGVQENILQFESSGSLTGRVLFVGVNQSGSKRFNLFSGYLWFDFHTNADHTFMLPQSSYTERGEWARPRWQARHRMFLVGLVNLPWALRASAELNLASGTPFNITTGRDNNGDGNFNDRPSPTNPASPNAVTTRLGAFDPTVVAGSLVRNAGTNPSTATLDLNLSRAFSFGKKDHPFQVTLNGRATNLLNRANLSGIDGVLNSPLFGRPNIAAPARRIEIGARFDF